MTDSCQTLDLEQGDSITKIGIYYSKNIKELSYITAYGYHGRIGTQSYSAKQNEFLFNNNSQFYGFKGT